MKITIKLKLFFLFLFIIIMLGGTASFLYYHNNLTAQRVDTLSEEAIPVALDAMRLQICVVQIQQWLTDISATRAAEGLDDGYDEAASYYEEAVEVVTRLEATYPKDLTVSSLRKDLDAFYDMGKQMADRYINGGTEAGNEFMASFDPYAEKITDSVQLLVDNATTELDEDSDKVVTEISVMTNSLFTIFAIVIIVTSLFVFFLSRSITVPIKKVVDILKEISSGKGDLTKRIEVKPKDEIGELSRYFNEFVISLHEMITKMSNSISTLEDSASQVNVAMDNSNEGVSEVNLKVESISSAVHEMTGLVHGIAGNTGRMSEDMRAVVEDIAVSTERSSVIQESASAGSKNLEELNQTMSSVAANTKMVFESIESLEQSSREIQNIVEMVRDIADQTNLLALNANIEAARAGEHGRGFAVVATEVSNLAQDSIDSVNKIAEIIEEIREKSKISYDSISTGRGLVDSATGMVNETSMQFREISQDITKVSSLLKAALVSVKEQNSVAESISGAMNNIEGHTDEVSEHLMDVSAAMQEQVATIEEVAASLGEVAGMTTELKGQTNQFQL